MFMLLLYMSAYPLTVNASALPSWLTACRKCRSIFSSDRESSIARIFFSDSHCEITLYVRIARSAVWQAVTIVRLVEHDFCSYLLLVPSSQPSNIISDARFYIKLRLKASIFANSGNIVVPEGIWSTGHMTGRQFNVKI